MKKSEKEQIKYNELLEQKRANIDNWLYKDVEMQKISNNLNKASSKNMQVLKKSLEENKEQRLIDLKLYKEGCENSEKLAILELVGALFFGVLSFAFTVFVLAVFMFISGFTVSLGLKSLENYIFSKKRYMEQEIENKIIEEEIQKINLELDKRNDFENLALNKYNKLKSLKQEQKTEQIVEEEKQIENNNDMTM